MSGSAGLETDGKSMRARRIGTCRIDRSDRKKWVEATRHHDVQYLTGAGRSLGERKTWGKGLELTAEVASCGLLRDRSVGNRGVEVYSHCRKYAEVCAQSVPLWKSV